MELPSYGWQLLTQLCTFCKEQHFCDCTIFIGNVHLRAHKVVLAAASLLFKSLLDSTDTISINASVLTPEEFALLLEMRYSGKLPVGKHNFTVISVADSLQMFDVAITCKNLLRDLISCSTQDQLVKGVSSQEADSSGNQAEANYLPQSGRLDEEKAFIILTQRVSPLPGTVEAEMEAGVSPPAVTHTWVHQDMMLSDSRSFQEDCSGPGQPAHAEWSDWMEEELAEPPEGKGLRDLAAESKSCKLDFFVYESVFSKALSDAQAVLKRLEECREIDACQKEALAACLAKAEEQSMFKKLLGQVKDAHTGHLGHSSLDTQTLVPFLKLFQDTNPELRAALLGREQGTHQSTAEEETLALLCCREELMQNVPQLSPIPALGAGEEGFLSASEKSNKGQNAVYNLLSFVFEGSWLDPDFDRLENWVERKQMRFTKGKWRVLPLGRDNPQYQNSLGAELLESSSAEKALGILVGDKLSMNWQCVLAARRASEILEDIGKAVTSRSREVILPLHLSLVVLDCCEGSSQREAMDNLLRKVDEENTLKMKFLGAVKASCPGLQLLPDNLVETAKISADKDMNKLNFHCLNKQGTNISDDENEEGRGDWDDVNLLTTDGLTGVATSESTTIEVILQHGKLILGAIQQREAEGLALGEAGLREAVKEI
ncbi:LOW QUALITY PROTEIN: zinc finger and BTB domain-containing protein 40 [Acridotheres tristis]